MTTAWLVTLIRSTLICILTLYAAKAIYFQLNSLKGIKKTFFLLLALMPITVPPLLPAYAYSAFSINFQTQPILNEILYCSIMIFRAIPISLLLFILIPSSLSQSSRFCNALLPEKTSSHFTRNSREITIACLTTLFIFHDYEIASLLRIHHWTVVLFNAHAGGLVMNLTGSLKMVILPALSSLSLVALSYYCIRNCQAKKEIVSKRKPAAIIITICSLVLIFIIPLLIVFSNSLNGLKDVFNNGWMQKEFINSLSLSIIATICCLAFSSVLIQAQKKYILISLIPGLLGSLILGLFFIYLFNLPLLNLTKQSILPLTLALVAYGIPLAIVISIAIKSSYSLKTPSISLLKETKRKSVQWISFYQPALLITLPLFCYLWFDLTISSMLAPASVTTLFPRLYNLMHYSENQKLSATVLLTSFIPFIVYLLIFSVAKVKFMINSKTSIN